MKFTVLRNDDYEYTLIGEKQNNGEFDWYPLIRLEYTEQWGDEPEAPYHCSLLVASPAQAKETGAWKKACESSGLSSDERNWASEAGQCEILLQYGTAAPMWQSYGKNKRTLLRLARQQNTILCGFCFGMWMDKPVNRMGTTGWQWIRGEL